jgi:hypothetical protein
LEKRLCGIDDELGTMIRDSPIKRERDELLRSVPGGDGAKKVIRLPL